MDIQFRKLHPLFAAEVTGIDLRRADSPEMLKRIQAGMDEYAVLVFPDQPLTDADQLGFAQRFDGSLHTKTGISALQKNRFGNEALTDISNVTEGGDIMAQQDRRRAYSLANRLWHADATFQDPPGRYSMLHARVIPPVGADTEFADMRAAYDELSADIKTQIEGLQAHHSIAYSRQTLGFEFSDDERERLKGAIHPLVRTLPRSGRKTLYLASHAFRIIGWPVPDARLLLRDLMEHATQRKFVYRHAWRLGDLVLWDNRCTMHRATPFEDGRYKRELRRVTTLDIEPATATASAK
ncbi:MAG: TauD/TfdA family dioxygenase [Betaproteobacteria bacterium]|nr:MAG: TauD/TfdA family dioxygenase [Betaproteobacteria bacterium]